MIKTEMMVITPEMAEKMLKTNTKNRAIKQHHVDFLAMQMKQGKWLSSGDTIKFSDKGKLLDGQHRLHAGVKSGKPFESLVVTGLKEETFNVIDTGRVRNAADVIGVNGYKNSVNLASAARFVMRYNANTLFQKTKGMATNQAILDFINKNKDLTECGEDAVYYYSKSRLISVATVAALLFIFKKNNVEKAPKFFDKFTTGIDLKEGDPILVLRNKLMQDSLNKRKMKGIQKISLIVLAWNAFVKGGTLKNLRLPDSFPKAL
jgi:hypothetical protein